MTGHYIDFRGLPQKPPPGRATVIGFTQGCHCHAAMIVGKSADSPCHAMLSQPYSP
jgi:hypothetical protein